MKNQLDVAFPPTNTLQAYFTSYEYGFQGKVIELLCGQVNATQ